MDTGSDLAPATIPTYAINKHSKVAACIHFRIFMRKINHFLRLQNEVFVADGTPALLVLYSLISLHLSLKPVNAQYLSSIDSTRKHPQATLEDSLRLWAPPGMIETRSACGRHPLCSKLAQLLGATRCARNSLSFWAPPVGCRSKG